MADLDEEVLGDRRRRAQTVNRYRTGDEADHIGPAIMADPCHINTVHSRQLFGQERAESGHTGSEHAGLGRLGFSGRQNGGHGGRLDMM
jgi:hypothetical protein